MTWRIRIPCKAVAASQWQQSKLFGRSGAALLRCGRCPAEPITSSWEFISHELIDQR